MKPDELSRALQTRRRQLGLFWWQVALELDVGEDAVHRLRAGKAGPDVRRRAEEWLRRPNPPREE
ncbi:hypothetical protein [Nonomuraea aridisoli]|uniref:XRE family transcriptional regulator n=1 Tax=Nonomuraea aridisoli TaxID=2070368 RepID=A0A2W2EWI2_9ACTN|nr:hypothetical protein [Nonomuraea aridisoli]PZG20635.1 hypothetical protein C1J01_09030 [Nonomuraea aridisoli]